MGFLSRLFGKRSDESSLNTRAKAQFKGRMTDLEEAERLSKRGQWDDALAIVDRVLSLPDDIDGAVSQLRQAMKASSSPIELETTDMGKDASGQQIVNVRMAIGGGLIPPIMHLRGRCINGAIFDTLKKTGGNERQQTNDPRIVGLARLGLKHAAIVWQLLPDDADAIAVSGLLLHGMGRFDESIRYFSRALELNPSDPVARQMLGESQQRRAQYGSQ